MTEALSDLDVGKVRRIMAVLADRAVLDARLDSVARRKGLHEVRVAVWVDGHTETLGVGPDAVIAGCLAKLLTGMLVGEAVAEGRLGWDGAVGEIVACDEDDRRKLAGVTVAHLLDHAHGLDASNLAGVPLGDDERIDVAGLCSQLGSKSLHEPGRMYSYGHVGAWLAAAVLEKIHGASYVSLLRRAGLFQAVTSLDVSSICPATGGDLALDIDRWLGLAQATIRRWRASSTEEPLPIELPGWHPSERAVCRGWKCYGDGWMGHNANLAASSAVLRIHPGMGVAILVSARDANGAAVAASGVFADVLPEFYAMRPPRLVKAADADASALLRHVGRYAQARSRVEVAMDDQGALQLRVELADADASPPRRLRQAEHGLFLAESGGSTEFLFVQFVAADAVGASGFLWNGRQVWRRITETAHALR